MSPISVRVAPPTCIVTATSTLPPRVEVKVIVPVCVPFNCPCRFTVTLSVRPVAVKVGEMDSQLAPGL